MSKDRLEVIKADITKVSVDAIVNASDNILSGGGGVDLAIHQAGGKAIVDECMRIREEQGGCPTGSAVITSGGDLPAKYVIHTVGPVWNNGEQGEEDLLRSCYRQSLDLAVANQIKTIAFPNISTGVFRFPKELAATIAVDEVKRNLYELKSVEKVIFVCFDEENYRLYLDVLG